MINIQLDALQRELHKQLLAMHRVPYLVKDKAPSTYNEVLQCDASIIYAGASDRTIFGSPDINWLFRALHDRMHLDNQLYFTPDHEIELGRVQASTFNGTVIQELIHVEIVEQVHYYKLYNEFPIDQLDFTVKCMHKRGYIIK